MSCTLYRFYDKDKRLLYVGISVRGPRRWREHAADKVWYSDVATATMEHFPTTVEALKAEEAAIKSEGPAYNVVHNGKRTAPVPGVPSISSGKWRFEHRRSGFEHVGPLYLYPELDCSSCVDDVHWCEGEEQLTYYVEYLERKYPHWLEQDAVPIYWSVSGCQQEYAPFSSAGDHSEWFTTFLDYFTWPEDAVTGERLDWFRLPVVMDRFPEFSAALGWTPSPLQPTAPLASIMRSRRGMYLSKQTRKAAA